MVGNIFPLLVIFYSLLHVLHAPDLFITVIMYNNLFLTIFQITLQKVFIFITKITLQQSFFNYNKNLILLLIITKKYHEENIASYKGLRNRWKDKRCWQEWMLRKGYILFVYNKRLRHAWTTIFAILIV